MSTARIASQLGKPHLQVWQGSLKQRLGKPLYELRVNTLENKPFYLHALMNKVVLLSNVATQCKWTDFNLEKLAEMELNYRGQLQMLLFPSNDFGDHPNAAKEFRQYANRFGNRFHIMEKIKVNGHESNELIRALKMATGTEDIDIAGNYETKFLVARDGDHVERISNAKDPHDLIPFIDRLVGEREPHRIEDVPEEHKEIPDGAIPSKSPASFVNTG